MTPAARQAAAREISRFRGVPGEESGWQWVRRGTNDYLVVAPDPLKYPAVLVVLQLDVRRLTEAVSSSGKGEGTQAGIRLDCHVADTVRPEQREGSVLLERRLAPPLDRLAITASPADPLAFAASARLKKRLYGAGGLLLVLGLVSGAWILWRATFVEIRMAKEHSDFAAAVSHDLRTPLSSMRMLAESLFLERVQDAEKRRKFLGTILKESDRLSRLTDRALYFIRYGEGALRYRFTEGDLGTVVQAAVETFATGIGASVSGRSGEAPSATDAGANAGSGWTIRVEIEPDLESVWFDAGAIEQVVFNLLDNAVKYSGRSHIVEVGVRRYDGKEEKGMPHAGWLGTSLRHWLGRPRRRTHIELAIRDHGPGMGKEEIRRILRPYTRGRTAAETHAHGIGLGLALCRHVVRAHKGRLEVESRVGEGSKFRVILPAGK